MNKKIFSPSFKSILSSNLKSKIQNLKWVGILAIAVTFAFGAAVATAQQPTKVPRIGYNKRWRAVYVIEGGEVKLVKVIEVHPHEY